MNQGGSQMMETSGVGRGRGKSESKRTARTPVGKPKSTDIGQPRLGRDQESWYIASISEVTGQPVWGKPIRDQAQIEQLQYQAGRSGSQNPAAAPHGPVWVNGNPGGWGGTNSQANAFQDTTARDMSWVGVGGGGGGGGGNTALGPDPSGGEMTWTRPPSRGRGRGRGRGRPSATSSYEDAEAEAKTRQTKAEAKAAKDASEKNPVIAKWKEYYEQQQRWKDAEGMTSDSPSRIHHGMGGDIGIGGGGGGGGSHTATLSGVPWQSQFQTVQERPFAWMPDPMGGPASAAAATTGNNPHNGPAAATHVPAFGNGPATVIHNPAFGNGPAAAIHGPAAAFGNGPAAAIHGPAAAIHGPATAIHGPATAIHGAAAAIHGPDFGNGSAAAIHGPAALGRGLVVLGSGPGTMGRASSTINGGQVSSSGPAAMELS